MRARLAVTVASLAVALAACQRAPDTLATGPRPEATIQEIMLDAVDPAADVIWQSVGIVVDKDGETIKQPRSTEDWEAVRRAALTLEEAPNLVVMPGRRVADPGKPLEGANAPGMLSADQIQANVDGDRAAFAKYARALQDLGVTAVAAADTHNVAALNKLGEEIDEACEACHLHYWYPPNSAAKPKATLVR